MFTLDIKCVVADTREINRTSEVDGGVGNESNSGREGEEDGINEVVCDDVTTSLVRFTSRMSAATHLISRVNAVNKYTCECTITSKIRAGCELSCANISC